MAGRAGRRGKDTKGDVIYLPFRDPEPVLFVEQMMTGKKAFISSQMDFHYGHILSSFQSGKSIIQDTYWASEVRDEIRRVDIEIEKERNSFVKLDEDTKTQIVEKHILQDKFSKSVNAEKKKWQSELSKWNNLHFGTKWETACKVFKTNMVITRKIEWLEDYKSKISNFDKKIDEYKKVLVATGYLENDVLTQKGVLASEVHEGHPLLMSYAFTEKLLHNKTAEEVAVNLSVFLEDVRTDKYIQKLPFHNSLSLRARHIADAEVLKSDFSYWSLTSYWADAVREWIGGDDFVCELFGIEQGNFVRAMLKLSNIVEEWVAMATIMQDTEMVEKMTGISQKIIRGAVIPDSLYLRI
jgi:superfamily II RNA helicase